MYRRIVSFIASLLMMGAVVLVGATIPADAGPTCYGKQCIGLNPSKTSCTKDAKTIAAMDVRGEGMLELRWSRSCNASWGRFTTYWRSSLFSAGVSYARVTAWNPGKKSQKVAGGSGPALSQTWWTYMVTGTTVSCTGVELFARDPSRTGWYSEQRSLGWTWGPCVA